MDNNNTKVVLVIIVIAILLGLGIWAYMGDATDDATDTIDDNVTIDDNDNTNDNDIQDEQDDENGNEEEMTRDEREAIVDEYLRDNISDLSPEEEVLGGTFMVTEVSFETDSTGVVQYEDGHIALEADFSYSVDENGDPEVTLSNVREM